ncbi:MAG: hypothetical protein V2A54_05215 [Bacteroidota bacterium]
MKTFLILPALLICMSSSAQRFMNREYVNPYAEKIKSIGIIEFDGLLKYVADEGKCAPSYEYCFTIENLYQGSYKGKDILFTCYTGFSRILNQIFECSYDGSTPRQPVGAYLACKPARARIVLLTRNDPMDGTSYFIQKVRRFE